VVRVGQPRPEIQFVPQHIAGLPPPVQHQVSGHRWARPAAPPSSRSSPGSGCRACSSRT
jgi:hypothetical protein